MITVWVTLFWLCNWTMAAGPVQTDRSSGWEIDAVWSCHRATVVPRDHVTRAACWLAARCCRWDVIQSTTTRCPRDARTTQHTALSPFTSPHSHSFLPRVAMHMLSLCVCLPVCPSVTRRYCTKRLNVGSRKQRHTTS